MNAWADLSSRPTTSPCVFVLAVLATFSLACPCWHSRVPPATWPSPIGTGTHVAATDDLWYLFTPATDGVYQASTCGLSTCDAKLWAYDECQGLVWDETGLNAPGIPLTTTGLPITDPVQCHGRRSVLDPCR